MGRQNGEDVHDPAGGDPGPYRLAEGFGHRAQRQHQEGGVAVEGDQLARRDPAGEGGVRPQPGEGHDEDPRQQHLAGVQSGLHPGHRDPGRAHLVAAPGVAGEELLLPADAAQHPQPRHRVRAEGGEPALRLALGGPACLQRADHRDRRGGQQRDSGEHEQTQPGIDPHQQHRDHSGGHHGPGEPRQDLEQLGQPGGVMGHRHRLPGGRARGHGRPGRGHVVADELLAADACLQPAPHHEPVAHHPGQGLYGADAEEEEALVQQGAQVAGSDGRVDGAAHQPGHRGPAEHPGDAEADPDRQGPPLPARLPQQETAGGAQVGPCRYGIGQGEHIDHAR